MRISLATVFFDTPYLSPTSCTVFNFFPDGENVSKSALLLRISRFFSMFFIKSERLPCRLFTATSSAYIWACWDIGISETLRWLVLLSSIIINASSSVKSDNTIQGTVLRPIALAAWLRLCPDKIWYVLSSSFLMSNGVITPQALILSVKSLNLSPV